MLGTRVVLAATRIGAVAARNPFGSGKASMMVLLLLVGGKNIICGNKNNSCGSNSSDVVVVAMLGRWQQEHKE